MPRPLGSTALTSRTRVGVFLRNYRERGEVQSWPFGANANASHEQSSHLLPEVLLLERHFSEPDQKQLLRPEETPDEIVLEKCP